MSTGPGDVRALGRLDSAGRPRCGVDALARAGSDPPPDACAVSNLITWADRPALIVPVPVAVPSVLWPSAPGCPAADPPIPISLRFELLPRGVQIGLAVGLGLDMPDPDPDPIPVLGCPDPVPGPEPGKTVLEPEADREVLVGLPAREPSREIGLTGRSGKGRTFGLPRCACDEEGKDEWER